MNPPAFQFYVDDFLGGTITMSNEERGLYIALLCLQWGKGGLTDDDIARMATPSFTGSMPLILSKFKRGEDGMLKNTRLEVERQKQITFRLECSESGKKGAAKRWGRHDDPNGVAIKTPMGSGTGKDGSPISDLRSPDQEVRTMESGNGVPGEEQPVNPPVDPNWPKRIAAIHQWYCEQVGEVRLEPFVEQLWWRWFKLGYEEDDFKRVLHYKRELINNHGDHPNALVLDRILAPDRFGQLLGLSKSGLGKPPPRKTGGATPLWRQREILEKKIATHPANKEFRGFNPEKVTPGMIEELKGLRENLKGIEAEEANTR